MARTVSNLPGPVASWIMGALAKGQRVSYFTDDPSGYVDSIPATDRLGRPVLSEGEGNAGQQLYRNVTKAETLPLYRITLQSLELPEKNNLYIFASVVEPGMTYFLTAKVAEWSDGVNEDSAFYASPTVKYRRVCVTPDNQVFPQVQITGFSSGQDKMLIAAALTAAGGYWAFGGGGAAAAGASATEAAVGASATEAVTGAAGAEAAAGAGVAGPMAPGVAGGAGAGAGAGITMSGVAKGAAAAVGAVTQVAGAVTQVSAALNDSGGGNTAPPPDPPSDNTIYWMVGGAILVIGVIL